MRTESKGVWRVLTASAAIITVATLAPAAAESLEGTWAARVAATIGVERAEAQWGVSRRTARRTSRRVTRRHEYYYDMPYAGANVVPYSGSYGTEQCYTNAGVYYCPRMEEGNVVYVVVQREEQDDSDREEYALLGYIRETADTGFHFSGTARMGQDDLAIVDPKLRVRGVERLRVIDASAMPTIVSGNNNAAVLLIGEKGADLVKAG